MPRLGRTDWIIVCNEQFCPRSRANDHEHMGLASAAGRISYAHFPLAHDACSPGRPYLLGNHRALAGRGVYLSVVDREQFARTAQYAYEAVLPDPASRLLTWVWPRWIPLDENARAYERFKWLEQELSRSKLPALIVWGREDEVFDAATFSERFKQMLPHAEGPHLVTGRHFLQEDSGTEIAALIDSFLRRLDANEGKQ